MKSMNYLLRLVGNRSWVLTLALTSLLSSGWDTINKNTAIAAPLPQPIQLSLFSQDRPPRSIVSAIIRDASQRSGVPIRHIHISQSTRKTFGNACVFNFGEICTKEYRPIEGWEVIVKVRNQSWRYHVNQSGSQILLDPRVNVEGNTLSQAIANKILSDASSRANLPRQELAITQAKPKTFGNSCEFNFGEICSQQYDPVLGWEVIVRVRNQSWIYHVDRFGSNIVLDPKAIVVDNNTLPSAIAENLIADAARRSGLPRYVIAINSVTFVTYGNACLFEFGELCSQIYKPVRAWEVIVKVDTQSWTYRVNQADSRIVLDPKVIAATNNTLPKAIAQDILDDAARSFGVSQKQLQITNVTRQVFGNSCVFEFGEICTDEYRPVEGWGVIVKVRNQPWTYHVNQSGSKIILDPKAIVATNNTLPPAIANDVIDDAMQRSGLSQRQIVITKVTPKTFGNFCEFSFGEVCTKEYQPIEGWEVTVRVRNQLWTYNVDQSGSQVIIDPRV